MNETLRLLQWLDRHPLVCLAPVGGLILLALARVVWPLLRGRHDAARGHDWWWVLPILAILFAGRWPSLIFTRELDADESQLLAGAHALAHDPVFWRSVNGGTAGPLDFFALWPAGWLCGWDTFLTARITAAALLAGGLACAHQAMSLTLGRRAARIATLAAASFEGLVQAADFLHYSTELLPVALLAAASYAAVRRWGTGGGVLWNGLGGLALGAVPFGKLQTAPLAALMGLAWVIAEWRTAAPDRVRRLTYLSFAALLPAALFACQLSVAGEWESFSLSYLAFNLHYTGASQDSAGQALTVMLGNSLLWDRLLPLTLFGGLAWLALLVRLRPVADPVIRYFTRAAATVCLVALALILLPKRPYLHYWQLAILPGALLLGALIARLLASSPPRWQRAERGLVALCAAGLIGAMVQHRARHPNWFVGDMAYYWHFSRSELAARVAACSRPGEVLAIWGRTDNIYVETGLRQATRDAHFGGLVEPGPLRQYFRDRYFVDLIRANAEVFLDSVGPTNPHYVDRRFAHDRDYPELAAVIRARYALVGEFEGARIYRRRDLPPP